MKEHKPSKRKAKDFLILALKGFAMGSADVVPGVSGGTIAFISGIYEELIQSIGSITHSEFLKAAFTFKLVKAFKLSNAAFLLALGSGIVLAIITLAHSLEQALESYPDLVWSFFFGLVVASVVVVRKKIKTWTGTLLILAVVATISSFFLVGLVPLQTPDSWWFLIVSDALAICAMILPGISGAFILVLLGKYEYALNTVAEGDYVSLGLIALGSFIGLITFVRVLGWLFDRYHNATIAVLIGLLVGSLRKVWPWKEITDESVTNIMPTWSSNSEANILLVIALSLMIIGFSSIMIEELYAHKKQLNK